MAQSEPERAWSSTADLRPSSFVLTSGAGVMHYWVMLTSYFIISLAVVFLILLAVTAVAFCCWSRLRGSSQYQPKTVQYSPIGSQDLSEEDVGGRWAKRRRQRQLRGLGHAAAHTYAPPKSGSGQWATVPVSPHMDISAGFLLLAYIEDHLRNRNRLREEWESLESYVPESSVVTTAVLTENKSKNRYPEAVPYDVNRVHLASEAGPGQLSAGNDAADYINASYIVDTDPVHPSYIATQGPLHNTVDHFWQMVWEQSVAVIVMLTSLTDMGLSQSCRYFPGSGVVTYLHFEVRHVSTHPHSKDYVIRSLYLRNTLTMESRTVTHFQYLSWPSMGTPSAAAPLLEFRRKVSKAHGRLDTPLLVHCSGGVGRTGAYILIDMALSRIQSGAKEINLAATVEHLRDQRPHMVKTKAQFVFALSALVEETHAMLDAATQRVFH